MSLTLSLPKGPVEQDPLPIFKSIRTAPVSSKARTAISTAKQAVMRDPIIELAKADTWYDDKSAFETAIDMFWSRRNIVGSVRSRRSYRTALKWQALATLPLFPPIGFVLMLFNICFGMRAKPTRIAFIASCAFAMLVIANATLTSDPTTLAALR